MKKSIPNLETLHALHRNGKIEDAKKGFLHFLKNHPQHAEALHTLALIYLEEKNVDEAFELLMKATQHQPDIPTYSLHLAAVYKMKGMFNQAITLLLQLLTKHPDYAPAFNNLGTIYYAQGKLVEAIQAYQQALKKEPHYVDAHYNLGLALTKTMELEKAAEVYQNLLQLTPEHAAARYQLATVYMQQEKWAAAIPLFLELALIYPKHFETLANLASCYLKQGSLHEAKKYYLKALSLSPQDQQILFNLGSINAQEGRLEEATRHYQELTRLNPDHFAAHYNLGVIYFSKKMLESAYYYFQEALRIEPQNSSVTHLLKILKKDQNLLTSPPDYLKSLFDYYADHYEPHLLNILSYQVPQRLLQAFEKTQSPLSKQLVILDLGCGTGLCGEVFALYAAKLIGVDLSSKMLLIAENKNIYDELICEDLQTYLSRQDHGFDLILAGDVLVYSGDLTTLFQATHKALRSGGLFIFNTEISSTSAYALNTSGRFAHKKNYIETLAQKNNLTLVSQETALTRLQDNQPVYGFIYVFQAL